MYICFPHNIFISIHSLSKLSLISIYLVTVGCSCIHNISCFAIPENINSFALYWFTCNFPTDSLSNVHLVDDALTICHFTHRILFVYHTCGWCLVHKTLFIGLEQRLHIYSSGYMICIYVKRNSLSFKSYHYFHPHVSFVNRLLVRNCCSILIP